MTEDPTRDQGRHRRRRVRRRRLCARAREAQGRPRHADRQERLPPVPAAAVPGRDVDAGGRATSPTRCARSRPSTTGSRPSAREVVAIDPVARTVTTATRRDLHRRLPRARGRLAAELLRDARAPSTPSRSTRSTTRSASGRGSSRPSRRPTATRTSPTRARSTSSSSAAGRPGVEVAGALSEMINTTMVHEFPSLAPQAKVHLVDHGHGAAQDVLDKGHAYAARVLEKDGVELRLGTGVTDDRSGPRHAVRRLDDQDALRHLGRRPDGRARSPARAGCRRVAAAGSTSARTSRSRASRASSSSATSPTSRPRTARPIRSSARSRCRAARAAANTILADIEGKHAEAVLVPRQGDDGDDRPRRGRRPGQGRRAARQARVRGLARRPRGAHDRRQQSRRRVQELGAGLLRQGPRAAGARPERHAPDGLGGGRRRRAGRRGATTDDRAAERSWEEIVSSDGRYDVIIIGSGAGGGTLAAAPRAVGQADPHPRARRLAAARDRELGLRRRSSSRTGTCPKETWYDDKDKPFQPGIHYCGRRRDQAVRRGAVPAAAARTSASSATTTASRPRGRSRTTSMEPYYTKAEQLYEVHGNRGEDPTEGHASAPYPFPALTHEPRIQQLSDDLERAGYHPFHAPCGVRLLEDDMPNSHCIRCATCDGFPCLVQAKSDAEMLGVRPALEHPNVTLLTNARGRRGSRPNAAGTTVDRGRWSSTTAPTETYRGDIVVVSAGAANSAEAPARLGQRPAPERARQRLRPGRPQLHVPQQRGGPGDLQGAEPDAVPEDARAQRLLLRDDGLRVPDGQHPDGRQVRRRDVQGREAAPDQARADVLARPRSPRTPSTSGCRPRTCRRPTTG